MAKNLNLHSVYNNQVSLKNANQDKKPTEYRRSHAESGEIEKTIFNPKP